MESPDPHNRGESPCERLQVQDFHLDFGGPEIAVTVPEASTAATDVSSERHCTPAPEMGEPVSSITTALSVVFAPMNVRVSGTDCI